MGISPNYNLGAFGSYDYNALMNNPYFLAAFNSPNINFKADAGAQNTQLTSQYGQTSPLAQTTGTQSFSQNNLPVDYAAAKPDESNTGLWVTGAVGAAALIGCMKKGGGNPIKGAQLLYEKFFKSAEKKTAETAKTVLKSMQAVKNSKGEIKFNVPNKTKTFAGTHVENGAAEYGLKDAISASEKVFNPENGSALRGFQVNTPVGKYTVFMKDGNVSRVIQAQEDVYAQLKNAKADSKEAELLKRIEEKLKTLGAGKNQFQFSTPTENYAVIVKDGKIDKILTSHKDVCAQLAEAGENSSDALLREKIAKIAEELGKTSKDADKSLLKDAVNISYVNKNGDNTLKLTMGKYGDEAQIKSFKTLEQFDKDSLAVKQYEPTEAEKIFAGELVSKKGVLAEGVGVLKCDEEIVKGTRCFFEGDKLVKIVQGENTFTENSNGFINFVKEHSKEIDKFKKAVFTDRTVSKIPAGSIIGVV